MTAEVHALLTMLVAAKGECKGHDFVFTRKDSKAKIADQKCVMNGPSFALGPDWAGCSAEMQQ